MYWIDVNNDNIMSKTASFLEKAKTSLEKPKDEPRYKVVLEYENEFKQEYTKGLQETFKFVLTSYKKQLKDASSTISNTGTTTNS